MLEQLGELCSQLAAGGRVHPALLRSRLLSLQKGQGQRSLLTCFPSGSKLASLGLAVGIKWFVFAFGTCSHGMERPSWLCLWGLLRTMELVGDISQGANLLAAGANVPLVKQKAEVAED